MFTQSEVVPFCPRCHQAVEPPQPPEVTNRLFEALGFYYDLGTGIVWNTRPLIAGFTDIENAITFKDRYPEFEVKSIGAGSVKIIKTGKNG